MSQKCHATGGRKPTPSVHEGVMLRVRSPHDTLDGYLFQSIQHAVQWVSQPFVTDEEYGVALCTYKERPCCGARYRLVVKRTLRIDAFLAAYQAKEPTP